MPSRFQGVAVWLCLPCLALLVTCECACGIRFSFVILMEESSTRKLPELRYSAVQTFWIGWLFWLPEHITKQDVPTGTEIWLIREG
jgi:hypothetical protein